VVRGGVEDVEGEGFAVQTIFGDSSLLKIVRAKQCVVSGIFFKDFQIHGEDISTMQKV
jgi:hypothetical protein